MASQSQFQDLCEFLGRLVERSSLWKNVFRTLAWPLRSATDPKASGPLTYQDVQSAKRVLIKFAQKEIEVELGTISKASADPGGRRN